MNKVKAILCVALVLALLSGAFTAFALTPNEEFESVLSKLNYYLTVFHDAERNEDVTLDEIVKALQKLGSYSYASGFLQYSYILQYLEKGDYRTAKLLKDAIANSAAFNEYILSDVIRERYPAIMSTTDLAIYVEARDAENAGNKEKAISLYLECSLFFDSLERLIKLNGGTSEDIYNDAITFFMSGNYSEALTLFEELAEDGFKDSKEYVTRCLNKLYVGQPYVFGYYEQDNIVSNGKEPIEWIILKVNDDGSLVLISKLALDAKPYNTDDRDVTWETCTLREWLNEDFYNAAFSVQEQARIVPVTFENSIIPAYSAPGGKVNENKVWLLSENEVFDYKDKGYSYFTDDASRICVPTRYAIAQGASLSSFVSVDGVGACWWWLRSPGYNLKYAAYVLGGGGVSAAGNSVVADNYCVRPVVVVLP